MSKNLKPFQPGANLYFHIPFCLKKCRYCYFYSIEKQKNKAIWRYLDYLEKEIIFKKQQWQFPKKIKTVYIGGGTPTYLSLPLLKKLFGILYKYFDINSGIEFTVEINPMACDKEKLAFIKQQGVNRLSFGIQTVDKRILNLVGRIFNQRKAEELIECAKKLKFKTVNLDFMFRLPGQSQKSLAADIKFIKKVRPTSVYWYETKNVTEFMKKINRLRVILPYRTADDFIEKSLEKLGYRRLMTEFYTKDNKPCEYTFDWLSNEYVISFGPFAISKMKNKFYKNVADLKSYYSYLNKNKLPIFDYFQLNKNEYAVSHFTYLIRFGAVDLNFLSRRFGVKLEGLLSKEIALLVGLKFLRQEGNKLFLTHKGLVYTPETQIILLIKYKNFLKNLNFFLGRGYNLR